MKRTVLRGELGWGSGPAINVQGSAFGGCHLTPLSRERCAKVGSSQNTGATSLCVCVPSSVSTDIV